MNLAQPHERLPRIELTAVVVAGALHVVTEFTTGLAVSRSYNAAVCILFLAYAARRAARDRSLLRSWGLRTDTLRRSAPIYGTFVLAGALVIHGVGLLGGASFRLTALSLWPYLAWGLAQQFALQNLLAGNLAALLSPAWPSAMLAALLFAAAHVPRFALAGVAFVGGFAFVLLYRRFPNLYAAGAAHGVLGWLLFGCLGWS